MRNAIALMLLILGTTACESAKSGAEISDLGESLVSTNDTPAETQAASGPAVDYHARTALNYANAVAACQTESRALCTIDQYATAYAHGDLDYSLASPGNFWMTATTQAPGASGFTKNVFQATADGMNYLQVATTLSRAFYCCL